MHYNVHRYYSPDHGMYWSQDPIGLDGGLRTHGYVNNPNTQIDPWGLTACGTNGATKGTGLGKLEGRTVNLSEKGLNKVENHLTQFGNDPANAAMVERLRAAQSSGQSVTGADAVFYTHELAEATAMARGATYDVAHQAALSKYGVYPFSVYHPEVITTLGTEAFSPAWFKFWGINQ